ncbi:MAG: hypothetical protein KAY24_14760, partial [Candidatus Eisenbacteria sp.]|nr:hypothetical protein [Candidatus Eisenbacteria bacterium]
IQTVLSPGDPLGGTQATRDERSGLGLGVESLSPRRGESRVDDQGAGDVAVGCRDPSVRIRL